MAEAPARHDYRDQAARYDETRGASPSIVGPLVRALEGTQDGALLDVAGGTGNYAVALRDRGWDPVVLDVSEEMLARARTKDLTSVRASASAIPFESSSFDALINISAIHLITDWRGALREMRRVLRPGGALVIVAYTRENLEAHWILGYFPHARAAIVPEHQSTRELVEELPGARVEPFSFADLVDASMSALCHRPQLLLDQAWRLQTSFFERLERDDPEEAAAGLARLAADLDRGIDPNERVADVRARYGDGSVIAWRAPAAD